MFTTNDLFEIAVNLEKNGEATYKKSLTKLKDKKLISLLQWMADEEACHMKWFADQQKESPMELDEADLKKMVPDVIAQMMSKKSLSLDDVDFGKISLPGEMIELFIGFEKETIEFYGVLGMFIEEENTLEGLHSIIAEEEKHIEKLTDMLESLKNTL